MSQIPKSFQAILWSQSVETLDLKRDRAYIIHQVLNYGNLKQIKWLKEQYSAEELRRVFVEHPTHLYYPSSYNFVKNYVLQLDGYQLDENQYLKTTPRDIRFRPPRYLATAYNLS